MNRLLIDLGNSRVKWAWLRDGMLDAQRAAAYASWSTADWCAQLFDGAMPARVDEVVVSSVAAAPALQAVSEASVAVTGREARRVVPVAAACGVRNAYRDPLQLGVDRWLAVVAAHAHAGRAVCVVDAGTAMTVDAVDAAGLHRGGYIVPGLRLMHLALNASTGDLAQRSRVVVAPGTAQLADNTRDAIGEGCASALVALIERVHGQLVPPRAPAAALLLTGGDAPELLGRLAVQAELIPDLVLRGLALVAAA